MKTNFEFLNSSYRAGLGSVLMLIVLPSSVSFDTKSALMQELSLNPQGQIQLAHARELLGQDSIHFFSSSTRRVDQVNAFVHAYTARALKGHWKNQATLTADTIIDESRRYGFDPLLLLAVIENESRFSPEVIGTHGEIGLMQIKPTTAKWIAKKTHIEWKGSKSLSDPSTNVRLGAAYLAMLRSEFRANKDLYLSAYNMGSKNVRRRVLETKVSPQIYAQKTIKYYSRIFIEFLGKGEKQPAASHSYAAI